MSKIFTAKHAKKCNRGDGANMKIHSPDCLKKYFFIAKNFLMYLTFLALESGTFKAMHTGLSSSEGGWANSDKGTELTVCHVILAFLCCYSVFRLFCLHDKEAKKRFSEKETHGYYFSLLAYTATCKDWLQSLAVVIPASLVFGCGCTFKEYIFTSVHPILKGVIGALMISLVLLLANTGSKVYIYDLKNQREDYEKLGKPKYFLIELAVMFAVYTVGAWAMFIAVMVAVSAVKIIVILPGLAVAIAVFVLSLPWIIFFVNAIFKRKRFIKLLKKRCAEHKFELSELKRPYVSLCKRKSEVNFTVKAHGKTYSCRMIPCLYNMSDMYFAEDGTYIQRYPIRLLKVELFSLQRQHKYEFDAENEKIIIACPVPYSAYIVEFGEIHQIDTGRKLWDYKFFSSNDFLTCLDCDKI